MSNLHIRWYERITDGVPDESGRSADDVAPIEMDEPSICKGPSWARAVELCSEVPCHYAFGAANADRRAMRLPAECPVVKLVTRGARRVAVIGGI